MIKMIIKDVGEPFDGLVVYIDEHYVETLKRPGNLVPILRIENKHALFETFSLPLKEESLYLDVSSLAEYRDTVPEQLTDNPFGKFLYNGKASNGNIDVSWSAYSKAFTVTVKNGDNTLYSHNFMSTERAALVAHFVSRGVFTDWDNLIFDLQDLETKEIEVVSD
ncbi:MAG: hypothetical protein ACW99G_10280 [Candidatus Thorarchaeota archaeon]|jgi:hypothetical protein